MSAANKHVAWTAEESDSLVAAVRHNISKVASEAGGPAKFFKISWAGVLDSFKGSERSKAALAAHFHAVRRARDGGIASARVHGLRAQR
jgi:hypothetical protein